MLQLKMFLSTRQVIREQTLVKQFKKYFGFERFTEKAINAIKFARNEATRLQKSQVEPDHHSIAAQLKLKPDPKGTITFLKQFGKQNYGTCIKGAYIAEPLLIHAELMTENDDRIEETAELLFATYIKDRCQNA